MRYTPVSLTISLAIVAAPLSVHAWQNNGVPVTTAPGNQSSVVIAPGLASDAIIAWVDGWDNPAGSDIYAQRVDASGIAQWTAGGVPICTAIREQREVQIMADGTGGAILVWRDIRTGLEYDIYAQRVDASGNALWGTNGRLVYSAPGFRQNASVFPDGQGGAIVLWEDGARDGILAQRLDASGALLWNANAVEVNTTPNSTQYAPRGASDGAGGAIITWADDRNYPDWSVYVQRVDATGLRLWAADGINACAAAGSENVPEIVPDGNGGAVMVFWSASGLSAQRVDGSGSLLWTANGRPVCTVPGGKSNQRIVPGSNGSSIIVWNDGRSGLNSYELYAQRLDASGNMLWALAGVSVCSAWNSQPLWPLMAADGNGGALVTWHDYRALPAGTRVDVYAQRVDAAGNALWTPNGVPICIAPDDQNLTAVAADGTGGGIIAWEDPRDRAVTKFDIYAQRISSGGEIPTSVRSGRVPRFAVGSVHPNPSGGKAIVELELASDSQVRTELVDVAGRQVGASVVRSLGKGMHALDVNASSVDGRRLPSGVYFFRVHVAGETIARKIVIAR